MIPCALWIPWHVSKARVKCSGVRLFNHEMHVICRFGLAGDLISSPTQNRLASSDGGTVPSHHQSPIDGHLSAVYHNGIVDGRAGGWMHGERGASKGRGFVSIFGVTCRDEDRNPVCSDAMRSQSRRGPPDRWTTTKVRLGFILSCTLVISHLRCDVQQRSCVYKARMLRAWACVVHWKKESGRACSGHPCMTAWSATSMSGSNLAHIRTDGSPPHRVIESHVLHEMGICCGWRSLMCDDLTCMFHLPLHGKP